MVVFEFYDEVGTSWVNAKYIQNDQTQSFLSLRSNYFASMIDEKLDAYAEIFGTSSIKEVC